MTNAPKVITVAAKPREITVPLSLRAAAELVSKHKGEQPDAELDAPSSPAEETTKAADKVQSGCSAVPANEMQPSLRNTADAKALSFRIFERISPRLDGARKRAEAALAQLERSMKPPAPKDA